MIGVVDCEIQALNPNMPLYPMRAYVNSPSSIRIRNVPKRIGEWCIKNVYFNVAYPDGSIKSAQCVLVGGIWVGTVSGSSISGTSLKGYTIFASGVDEYGEEVNGYVLGKGDVIILEADGTITPGVESHYVHLLSAQSDEPKDGDLWPNDGTYYIWQNGQARPIGDDSGLIGELSAKIENKADLSNVLNLSSDERQTVVQIPNFSNGVVINNYMMEANDTGVIAPKHYVERYVNDAIVNKADLSALDNKADLSTLSKYLPLSGGTISGTVAWLSPYYHGIKGSLLYTATEGIIRLENNNVSSGVHFTTTSFQGLSGNVVDWPTQSGRFATEGYVDSIVGDIETILNSL